MPNAKITLFDADHILYYQSGFTLIATGVYDKDDVSYEKKELINEKVQWVQENVISINPKSKSPQTTSGATHAYDYLIIATGTTYEFELYKGLSE